MSALEERNLQIIEQVMNELHISDIEEVPATVVALRSHIHELEEALMPFVNAFETYKTFNDVYPYVHNKHFRRAAEVLKGNQ